MTANQNGAVKAAYISLYKDIFVQILEGLIKAKGSNEVYAGFGRTKRDLTESEIERMSEYAASHFVDNANPSQADLTKARIEVLKTQAIEHAIQRFRNDHDPPRKKGK